MSIHNAFAEAAELAELLGAAAFQSSVPYTAQFPTEHPACLGSLTRTQTRVRAALEPFDLLFCIGADLLRMKGIVQVAEAPNIPAVIHGVQHVYHAPVWLARWPSADRRTRMVFIGRRLRESWVRRLIDFIDVEVAEENARRGGAAKV